MHDKSGQVKSVGGHRLGGATGLLVAKGCGAGPGGGRVRG